MLALFGGVSEIILKKVRRFLRRDPPAVVLGILYQIGL